MIQSRADSKGQPAFLSFRAMDQLMQNIGGESFTYEEFKQMYDSVPGIKDIVKNFDENGLTIDTKEGGEDDAPTTSADNGDANVAAAAKRATNKSMGADL
jgi:hypothetical protein